jgi:hypothetical protein
MKNDNLTLNLGILSEILKNKLMELISIIVENGAVFMKPLIQEIQEILSPDNTVSMIQENMLYQLQPLLPLAQVLEMAEGMDDAGQKKLLAFLTQEGTVIFNKIVYVKTKGFNFKGRLQEILTIYNNHLRQVVGDKKALIDLYDALPVEDLANLIEDHVIFVMKKLRTNDQKALAAIRYLPEYDIHFDHKVYRMPPCMIAVYIDENLTIGEPEVITEKFDYEHPFVFRDVARFGQRICMGSFSGSSDKVQFSRLRFANNLNNLIKQAVQILVTGYNRSVTPANGHLTDPKYKKYLVKG